MWRETDEIERSRRQGQVEGHLTQRWNRHIDASWPLAKDHGVDEVPLEEKREGGG